MALRSSFAVVALVALIPVATLVSSQTPTETELAVPQGWTQQQKQTWYSISQGSRLIPWEWLQALEQAGSTELFLAPQHISKFRYLPGPATGNAAAVLPVGFALDAQSEERLSELTNLHWRKNQGGRAPWVGMNCAACHTGELTFNSLRLRIEGAPAMSDYQGFINALNRALEATRSDPAKWARFSARVLGAGGDDVDRDMLTRAFGKFLAWQAQVEKANQPSLQYGPARVDAFGHIYNKVLLRVNAGNQPFNPSDAPVSYPFLWNIHQHDKVQWNGSAPNAPLGKNLDIGALARNVGEVTGVFADVTVRPALLAGKGYPTSANIENLLALEQQITQLKPPNWPAELGAIDASKWQAGQKLFQKACAQCHLETLKRDDLTTRFNVTMTKLSGPEPIGTDPWMACNAYTYNGNTGDLLASSKKFFPSLHIYGSKSPVSDMLGTVVIGSIWNRGGDVIEGSLEAKLKQAHPFDLKQAQQTQADLLSLTDQFLTQALGELLDPTAKAKAVTASKASRLKSCMATKSDLLAYKGRPLVGIWATAPYLHNGSVPTLYDLLLPPAQRPTQFSLGTREFDPKRVGYAYEKSEQYLTPRAVAENTFVFKTVGDDGKAILGNSNAGHDYGNAGFSDEQRWQLVEYMKAANARWVGGKVVP